ncbi:MAG: hypothetical protein ONB46_18175 [candidate division KSB1 bacterium]|nr:hypothetical protein [candidate division KSB1 bacterium]MDZ7367773.1 hypothetical protein [candidate division KSB1 bacterium]MDZ7406636.1 hypothetical protein [candidate division KSB1 bacterium]
MITETVLKQVRDRLGPLNGQAEQAVAAAVEIIRQMNGPPSSPIIEDSFKGENVSLEEYESWSDDQQARYQSETERNNAKWIEQKMRDLQAMWLIVIDGQIVASGPKLRTFPHDEEFDELCEKTGKFPFVFFSPRMFYIEETVSWHSTAIPGDSYPTVQVNLKTDAGETELEADFDTGAMDAYLDLDFLLQHRLIMVKKRKIMKDSSHLGQNYRYITKSIWLGAKDKNGQHRHTKIVAICVANWRQSPFVAINPNRTALVGRDTMLQLQPAVLLDFANRQTEVEYRAPIS